MNTVLEIIIISYYTVHYLQLMLDLEMAEHYHKEVIYTCKVM